MYRPTGQRRGSTPGICFSADQIPFPSSLFFSSVSHPRSPPPPSPPPPTMRSTSAASILSLLPLVLLHARTSTAVYFPLREYAGESFFANWDFYDNIDDTTWGNVTFLGAPAANSTHLIDVNTAGNAIIKVDDTTTIAPATLVHRNSIRITSQDTYGVGSVIVADFVQMPYGCSVWPSFWLLGQGDAWPAAGEIDIVEGINLVTKNQFSLHTPEGCQQQAGVQQTGKTIVADCIDIVGTNQNGCITEETKPNSFGEGFAKAGGGVYAIQIDVSGIFMWFWTRAEIPKSITSSTSTSSIDLSDWGTPSAAYPAAACNITQFFQPQKMILDITLCGMWAGVQSLYSQTCPGNCVNDNIIGSGAGYSTAYFEIPYIRTYSATQQNADTSPTDTSSSTSPSPSTSSNTTDSDTNAAKGTSGASVLYGSWWWSAGAVIAAALSI
ncbi:glycoside hydrolase family 16 protein [Mycena amicta]|nr:glycoside hydrolase family 16 protein [Mycena amicta]